MTDIAAIIKILELSVERNGEQPLTNKWLLNIIKMAMSCKSKQDEANEEKWLIIENSPNIY